MEDYRTCSNCELHCHKVDPFQVFKTRPRFLKEMAGDFSKELALPQELYKHINGVASERAILESPSGKLWLVELKKTEEGAFFQNGWKEFIKGHSVKLGESIVFRYDGNLRFDVQIFGSNGYQREDMFIANTCKKSTSNEGEGELNEAIDAASIKSCKSYAKRKLKFLLMNNFTPPVAKEQDMGVDNHEQCVDVSQTRDCKDHEKRKLSSYQSKLCKKHVRPRKLTETGDSMESTPMTPTEDHLVVQNEIIACPQEETVGKPDESVLHRESGDPKNLTENGDSTESTPLTLYEDLVQNQILVSPQEENVTRTNERVLSSRTDGYTKEKKESIDVVRTHIPKQTSSPKFLRKFQSGRRVVTLDEKARALEAANSFKTNNPRCVIAMKPSNVYHCFYLHIPRSFAKMHLPKVRLAMHLRDPTGREWEVICICREGNATALSGGWAAFSIGNNLEEGDVCIFELKEEKLMAVHIFRVVEEIVPLIRCLEPISAGN
ncbi:B3 domain-containing protein Os01g0723500 isoform X2 [Amborella trichopoda]|uniref:B3 domain-containing protein Os01g0723500 isoform X2 n=1 Tax=Amborella trichopoda TaxID=13333 RepID=UPI0005D3E863|nr:B3 domain-containing protein Os01g0723500 isoform X2 [Amborella trichopoda]|eukprot:XP_011621668.1 B3 domain-containing protein Os01g0723500 isoform X2 [Amborella trichopoda]